MNKDSASAPHPHPPPHPPQPSTTFTSIRGQSQHQRLKSLMFNFLRSATGTPSSPASTPTKEEEGGQQQENDGTQKKKNNNHKQNPANLLFPPTDPAVDGDECLHDCAACTVRYPRGFKIEEDDDMYGQVKGWATHLVVATGKADWKREVEDEKGSVMEAVGKAGGPSNGRMMLSASNMPTPDDTPDYDQPTTALLLPAFTLISNLQPSNVPLLLNSLIPLSPTTTTPFFFFSSSSSSSSSIPTTLTDPSSSSSVPPLHTRPCPHSAVILMCSQRTRDARCGQSAPLLRREFERVLRPLGLYRDMHDERPGGVGIYFVSHVGGHKYSANVMVYRRRNAFGQDDEEGEVVGGKEDEEAQQQQQQVTNGKENGENGAVEKKEEEEGGAAQCIWLGRVFPEDCENLIRYTVLKGKVVKPERQLRGGFDRVRGVMSW